MDIDFGMESAALLLNSQLSETCIPMYIKPMLLDGLLTHISVTSCCIRKLLELVTILINAVHVETLYRGEQQRRRLKAGCVCLSA